MLSSKTAFKCGNINNNPSLANYSDEIVMCLNGIEFKKLRESSVKFILTEIKSQYL